jgi:hypothetical protein
LTEVRAPACDPRPQPFFPVPKNLPMVGESTPAAPDFFHPDQKLVMKAWFN